MMTDPTEQQCEALIAKIQEDIDRNIRGARHCKKARVICVGLQMPIALLGVHFIIRHQYGFAAMDFGESFGAAVFLWIGWTFAIQQHRKFKKLFARQRDEVRQWLDSYRERKERGFY